MPAAALVALIETLGPEAVALITLLAQHMKRQQTTAVLDPIPSPLPVPGTPASGS
jgi:hypothetical protein